MAPLPAGANQVAPDSQVEEGEIEGGGERVVPGIVGHVMVYPKPKSKSNVTGRHIILIRVRMH
jgi:hypothetical protein